MPRAPNCWWARKFPNNVASTFFNNSTFIMKITANENDINDNRSYRSVCNMSLISFSLAVIFIIRLFSTSAFRVPSVHLLPKDPRFEHSGAKPVSCPGRHLTSVRFWVLCKCTVVHKCMWFQVKKIQNTEICKAINSVITNNSYLNCYPAKAAPFSAHSSKERSS